MAFSKEDKKKVFDFFQKILQEVEQPVYYEYLRGHINKADSVVKDYVLKKCKGEELLKYFQKRKNYFTVDFRNNEVSLIRKPNFLSTSSLAAHSGHTSEKISEPDNSYCSENSDIEFFSNSRSNSMSSMYESANSENEDHSNQVDDMIEESTYYEQLTLNYFCDLIRRKNKLNLNTIEIQSLPKNVKYYITRHLKSLIILFFKDNPDIFHIDCKGFITLVNTPLSAEGFQKIHPKEDTFNVEMEETESVTDYLQCVEFFAGLLKKRSLPLKTLSGKLSQAPPNVLEYLNANYETFKHFLVEADKLFTVKNDEISLCKDGIKLLKRARKLSSLKFNAEFTSQSIRNVLRSLFRSKSHTERSSSSIEQEETSDSDTCKLILPAIDTSAENISQLSEDEKLTVEIEEKCEASENLTEQMLDENTVNEESISHQKPPEEVTKKDVDNSKEILSNENVQSEYLTCDITGEAHESLHHPVECLFDKTKQNSQRNFIECIFIVHLLCLEVHEKYYILCLKSGYEAVKHFVKILEKLPGKTSDLNSLKGSLGQASSEVNFFMKQLYKGEKFKSFFVEHKEFVLESSCLLVKLSCTYKDCLEDRKKIHEDFVAGEKIYDVYNLYNSDLHETFVDAIGCLSKICCFLQNKSKTKLSRLNGMLSSKFSTSQLDFINTLNGSTIAEKFKKFLRYFAVFDILDEYVEISQNMDILLFVNYISGFSEKLINLVMKCDESKLPCFDYLLDYLDTYEKEKSSLSFSDLKNNVIDRVKSVIPLTTLDYSDLPKIVGYEVILMVLLEKKDSRILIQVLDECGLFKLENGQIFLKDSEENKFCENVNESSKIVSSQNLNDNVDIKSVTPALNSFCDIALSKNDGNNLGTEVNNISDIENEELNANASRESDKAAGLPHSDVKDNEIDKKEEMENDISNEQKSLKNKSFISHSESLSQIFHDSNIKDSECAKLKKHKETVSDKLLRKLPVSDSGSGEFVNSNLPPSPSSILVKSTCENEMKFAQKSLKDFNERNILKPYSANVLENTSEAKLGETSSVLSSSYMDTVKQISDVTEGNSEIPSIKRSLSENLDDPGDVECESNVFEINQQKQFKINSSCNEFEKNLLLSSEKHLTAVDEQSPSEFKNGFDLYQCEDFYSVRRLASETIISNDSEDKENKEYADFHSVINVGNQFSALSKNVRSFCWNNKGIDGSRSLKHEKKLIKGSVYPENISKESIVDSPYYEIIVEEKAVDKNMNELIDGNSNACNNKMSICSKENSNITEDCLTKSASFDSEECNNKIKQNKVSKNNKDSSLHNHNVSESFMSRKTSDITEEYDSSPSFLQPLLAKVILLTLDSCIVETIVSGCKKYVFCLKSSFHCDKHSNCLDCFDALTIGDELSCYVPPTEKFQCGNMCLSFMFCKESKLENTNSMQPEDILESQSYINEKLNKRCDHILTNTEYSKHLDSTHVETQSVNDCITEGKPCSLVIKKELSKCSIVSRHTQTVNSMQNVYFGVEKECQVKSATVSQDTQTPCQTLNNECQTDIIKACPLVSNKASQTKCLTLSNSSQTDFNIKICPIVCDKSSTTNYSTLSASTQTVISKLFENESQTDISGSIKPHFDACNVSCQTERSGHMQELCSFRDEYCQTHLVASEINAPVAENDAASEIESRFGSKLSTTSCVAKVDFSQFSPCILPQKEFCSTACQTICTGDIWIKKYYML